MLVNYWDKYTEMHGQQNVKKKKNPCPNWVYFTIHTILRRITQEILEEV